MKAVILVVDDNAANLKLACDVLESEAFTVLRAENAAQALEVIARQRPDLILMDLSMPGMDGLALTRKLKADEATRDIKVVALTASAMRGDESRAREAGCEGYITKPVNTRTLARQVAEHLEPGAGPGSRIILIVDDNAVNRRLLRATLEMDGLVVVEASDGQEALEKLETTPVDVVITDVLMPRMDGYRMCLELRKSERFRHLPLIVYTSTYTTAEDERLALNMGADRYFVKPTPARALLDAVRTIGPHRASGSPASAQSQEKLLVLEQYSQQLVGKLEERNVELARTTAELAAAHEKMQHLMTNSPAVIYGLNVSGRQVEMRVVSGNLAGLLGFEMSDALGYAWWEGQILPEDRERAVASIAETLAFRNRQTDYRIRHKDGSYRWVSDSRRLIRGGPGEAAEIVGVWTDLTERKRAEEALSESERKFRQLAENIQEVFWIRDLDGARFIYASPAFEKVWGLPVEALYRDPRAWTDAVLPDDRQAVLGGFAKLEGGAAEVTHEYRIVRADGAVRSVLDRGFPIRDGGGRLYRIAGVAKDVTDKRRLEEALQQAAKIEAIGQLAGGIAHDFNNILGCIMGYAELLEADVQGNEAALESVREVLKASQRARDLVRQILTFGRRHEQERRPLALAEVVADSLKLLRSSLPASIEIRTGFAEGLPAVLADATQIEQILLNLGTNSAHAMKGQGRLDVEVSAVEVDEELASTRRDLRPGTYVRLSVTDSGCGMAREVLERVFEPFFTTKPPGEGTGLGLSVVHGIVRSHEGAIAAYSEAGKGTTFDIYFPAHAGPGAVAPPPPAAPPRGSGEHVLFVDDEPQLVAVGRRVLERAGYRVTAFTSSLDALAAFRGAPATFDLVVMDLTMPNMSGSDVAREMLKLRADLPILLATGFGGTLTPARAQELGVRDLLQKPLTTQALTAAAHRALHSPRGARP